VGFVEMGFRFPEELGQASSGLALASAVVRRARFLCPVTTLFFSMRLFLCFCSRFWFWKQKFAYVSAIEKHGRVDLGTLRSGLLIWISLRFSGTFGRNLRVITEKQKRGEKMIQQGERKNNKK
jgi:hypothetical protein